MTRRDVLGAQAAETRSTGTPNGRTDRRYARRRRPSGRSHEPPQRTRCHSRRSAVLGHGGRQLRQSAAPPLAGHTAAPCDGVDPAAGPMSRCQSGLDAVPGGRWCCAVPQGPWLRERGSPAVQTCRSSRLSAPGFGDGWCCTGGAGAPQRGLAHVGCALKGQPGRTDLSLHATMSAPGCGSCWWLVVWGFGRGRAKMVMATDARVGDPSRGEGGRESRAGGWPLIGAEHAAVVIDSSRSGGGKTQNEANRLVSPKPGAGCVPCVERRGRGARGPSRLYRG